MFLSLVLPTWVNEGEALFMMGKIFSTISRMASTLSWLFRWGQERFVETKPDICSTLWNLDVWTSPMEKGTFPGLNLGLETLQIECWQYLCYSDSSRLLRWLQVRHFKLPFCVCMDALQLFSSEKNRFNTIRQKCMQLLALFSTILKLVWATNPFRLGFVLLEGSSFGEKQEFHQGKALSFVKQSPSALWSSLGKPAI